MSPDVWPCIKRCGTCAAWRAGECWSADRLDGEMTKGPADYTTSKMGCEAWLQTPTPNPQRAKDAGGQG